jgi:hypothetical protein
MKDTKVVQISGVARPTRRMTALATALHGPRMAASIDSMLEDAVAVDALAGAIDRALIAGTSRDGRIDLKETAIHLIREMRRSQK